MHNILYQYQVVVQFPLSDSEVMLLGKVQDVMVAWLSSPRAPIDGFRLISPVTADRSHEGHWGHHCLSGVMQYHVHGQQAQNCSSKGEKEDKARVRGG